MGVGGAKMLVGTNMKLCNDTSYRFSPKTLGNVPVKVITVTLNDLEITVTYFAGTALVFLTKNVLHVTICTRYESGFAHSWFLSTLY